MSNVNEFEFSFTNEDINNIAKLLYLVFTNDQSITQILMYRDVEETKIRVIHVEKLEDIKQYVNLDELYTPVLGITDPIGQLMKWLAEKFSWLVDTLEDLFTNLANTIRNALLSAIDTLRNVVISWFNTIASSISSAVTTISSLITNAISNLTSTVMSFFKQLSSMFTNFVNTIINTFQSISQTILNTIMNVVNTLTSMFQTLGNLVQNAFNSVVNVLTNFFKTIQQIFNNVITTISQFFTSISKQLMNFVNVIINTFQSIGNAIINAITNLSNILYNVFSNIVNVIQNVFTTIVNAISNFFANLISFISQAFTNLINTITEFATQISQFFTQIPSLILNALRPIIEFIQKIPQFIQSGLSWLWQMISNALTQISKAVMQVGTVLTGFVNAILMFPQWFPKWFYENIAKPIVEGMEKIGEYIAKGFIEFFKVIITLPEYLGIITNFIQNVFTNVINVFKTILGNVYVTIISIPKTLSNLFTRIWNVFYGFFTAVYDVFKEIANNVGLFFKTTLETSLKTVIEPLRTSFTTIIQSIVRGRGSEIEAIVLPIITIVGLGIVITMLPRIVLSFAKLFERFTVSLKVLGIGSDAQINISDAVKHTIEHLIKLPEHIVSHAVLALSLMGFETLRYAFRASWKMFFSTIGAGNIPIEIPAWTEMRDLLARYGIEQNIPIFREILIYRGYPDWFIEKVTKTVQEAYIVVKDRFGQDRKFPLSVIYEIPTPSEMCRMMVRDIFGSVDDFVKAMKLVRFHEDISYMFYLLHFKYPSPEKLWEFTCRAIAGELWFEPSPEMRASAQAEAQKIGAFTPVSPRELNFKGAQVFSALSTYMKWQDYAKFSWLEGFTSDNWLVIDILADVPTKIDMRWMARWGMYDYWSVKGIGITTGIEEIVDQLLIAGKAKTASDVIAEFERMLKTSGIVMDIRQYCRLLQARGLHPFWIPWVAIAEVINALTEERTLLRTGFMNMYKEGIFNMDMMHKLLGGFFTVKFKVAFYDIRDHTWKSADVEYPISFLPAESRLLEIRACLDRAVDMWRDFSKEIMLGLRFAVLTPSEAMNKLREFAKFMNEQWFKQEIQSLTGKVLETVVDERWAKVYIKVFETLADIEKVLRLRYWLVRIVAWAIYRLAYGYVTKEDLVKILSIVKERSKLTQYEYNTLLEIAELLTGIARREYIPTPTQLATIVEVVPDAITFVDKVLKARGVPQEWWDIWKRYIEIRPLYDEIRMFRTSLISAYAHGVISEQEFEKALGELQPYGFTKEEVEFLKRIAELRAKYTHKIEYIPTPSMLVTILEYVPEAIKKFEDVMKARHVPQDWIDIWKVYAERRPIFDELRRLVTRIQFNFSYGLINSQQLQQFLQSLLNFGFTDKEVELVRKYAVEYRRYRIFNWLIPSPIGLTGYYRYSNVALDFISMKLNWLLEETILRELIEPRQIRQFIEKVRQFYTELARNRAVYSDLRGYIYDLIRAYEYGVINDQDLLRELNELKKFGLKDENIQLIIKRAKLRKLIRQTRG